VSSRSGPTGTVELVDIPLSSVAAGVRRGLQSSEHRVLLVCGDLCAASVAVAVSMWIWSLTAGFPFDKAFIAQRAAWLLAALVWTLALLPSHNVRTALSTKATIIALLRATAVLLAAYLAVYFYFPPRGLPRLVALYILWEGALLVLAWRLLYLWFFHRAPFTRRVLVVGGAEQGRTAVRLLRDFDFRNSVVVGVLDASASAGPQRLDMVPVLAGRSLVEQVRELAVDEIVLAHPDAPSHLFSELVECQELGLNIITMPHLYEDLLHRIPVQHLQSDWFFTSFVEAIRTRDASRLAKRALDVVGSVIGLIAFVLVMPFVALAILLDSGRPILFRQLRTGRGGRGFIMLKYRTMVKDAERDSGPQWSGPNDTRVTHVGRFLRRLRLDELPNLVNVLKGEMSLVGPRPERPELVAILERDVPFYRTRLLVRPGLTGWAQVNRPYGDSVSDALEKLEYDLYYLKHRSLMLDVRILLRTIGTVLRFEGR
jgi:exopolysaccharide biosynthesis polyprenyl glycosylphosphotransferase